MTRTWFSVALSGVLLFANAGSFANAAEVKLFCPVAMKGVMSDLVPQFERSSGHKVAIEYGTVGALVDRLIKGESGDVAIACLSP